MVRSILLIEDEELLSRELARHYRREGWEVATAASLGEARKILEAGDGPLVVLADMSLPDGNALDLLEEVRNRHDAAEWVFLTAYGTVSQAVRGLRLGAFEFLEKPCDTERLDLVLAAAERSARAQRRLRDVTAQRSDAYSPAAWVGSSGAAQAVRDTLTRLSRVPISAVVIEGETGTGKGLAARILHASGPLARGPLVEVNCAALPHDLLESELFGHEAGAFTGARGRRRGLIEQAHEGTLFLDEIGDLDLDLQAKLLSAIENRSFRRLGGEREIQVDVQLIAATNQNLREWVAEGRFRRDLYHRLSVFRLELPPLREHKEDLAELVPMLVAEFNAKARKSVKTIPPDVWAKLEAYDWPGNVRELRNVLERSVLLADGETLPSGWLQLSPPSPQGAPQLEPASAAPPQGSASAAAGPHLVLPLDGSLSLDDMEREIVAAALEQAGGNVTGAARALKATRETMRYRVQKFGLKEGS